MSIARLMETRTTQTVRLVLVVTCLAGLANAALLGLINQVAEDAALGEPIGARLLMIYIGIFAFFYVAERASLREANRFVQQRLSDLRARLTAKIARADLRTVETLGHGELYATVGQEISQLSQTFPLIVSAAQSVFLLVFCLLYIATLSTVSFVAVAAFIAIGLYFFWRRRRALNAAMGEVYRREADMLDSLSHFTAGFQEIRLNADKNDALFARYTAIVDDLHRRVVGVGGRWVTLLQFSNAFLYALVGFVILVLPVFFTGYTDAIYKIVAAAIFCVAPVMAVTSVTPLYAKADMGLAHVYRLEDRLDRHLPASADAGAEGAPLPADFTAIAYRGVTFTYREADDQPGFTCGPWDFDLRRGEVVFLTGGNGSGKSTAMKLICGLYSPDSGRITVDDMEIGTRRRQDFRELFAAIFPDFHLFDRLHGLEGVAPDAVMALLARVHLDGKVGFADGAFTTRDLSTGQRKRLALVAALLDDRPVYLFDEWAADQDAHFRDFFYLELLPELRARGKAVLVVTHDDRYWSQCDRRIDLDFGRMQPVTS
jgi:putative ATP-binding cassette transporter